MVQSGTKKSVHFSDTKTSRHFGGQNQSTKGWKPPNSYSGPLSHREILTPGQYNRLSVEGRADRDLFWRTQWSEWRKRRTQGGGGQVSKIQ